MRSTNDLGILSNRSGTLNNEVSEAGHVPLETTMFRYDPDLGESIPDEPIGDEASIPESKVDLEYSIISQTIYVFDFEISKAFERVQQMTAGIDNLAQLAKNFDGEGSPQISRENRDAAKALVSNLFSTYGIQCDEVLPTQLGGVEIEASSQYWELALWVNDPEQIEYVLKYGGSRFSGKSALMDIPGIVWEKIA